MSDPRRLPPPSGAPRDTTPPPGHLPTPERRRRAPLVVSLIVVAALVVTGGVVWGAVSLGAGFAHRIAAQHTPLLHQPQAPRADGPRIATRWAPDPLACSGECLIIGDATSVAGPDGSARELVGTPDVGDYGSYTATDPQDAYADLLAQWRAAEPSGDDCMFTLSLTPSDAREDTAPAADGSMTQFLDEYTGSDQYPVLDTAARMFPDSAAADAYVHSFEKVIAGCRHYRLSAKDDRWNAQVSALSGWGDLPADITAIGWVEQDVNDDGFYGVDLERGNLVVRYSLATADLSRDGFQRFVSRMAAMLDSATPSPSAVESAAPTA